MAEHQLPKLTVRVRFPSSALIGAAGRRRVGRRNALTNDLINDVREWCGGVSSNLGSGPGVAVLLIWVVQRQQTLGGTCVGTRT
jgi:hypothetical protein